jgi:hypothetical protein
MTFTTAEQVLLTPNINVVYDIMAPWSVEASKIATMMAGGKGGKQQEERS